MGTFPSGKNWQQKDQQYRKDRDENYGLVAWGENNLHRVSSALII
jgi:hypothetical protein